MVEMTSREHLMNAVSRNSSIVNDAQVVGPAVAGFLMAQFGMTWCFLLNGLSFITVMNIWNFSRSASAGASTGWKRPIQIAQ